MPWKRDDYSIKELGMLAERFEDATADAPAELSRTRRRRWLVIAPVAAAAVIVVLLAAGVFRGDPTGALSLDEAVAALAKAAFESPLDQPGKTVYAHSRFTSIDNGWSSGIGSFVAERSSETESWYSGGKNGWYRWTLYPLRFPTAKDRAMYLELSGQSRGAKRMQRTALRLHVYVCKGPFAARTAGAGPAAQRLNLPAGTKIPTDPEAVYELLRDKNSRGYYVGPGGRNQGIWFVVEDALRGGGLKLNPAQRSAVAQSLGRIPGVRTLGRVNDPNGVPSIGFERVFDHGTLRSRAYFDAETAMTTYTDQTVLKSVGPDEADRLKYGGYINVPPGTVATRYEMLDYRYLDKAPMLKTTYTPAAADYCPHLRARYRRK